jgi:serine/threonine protein kinase
MLFHSALNYGEERIKSFLNEGLIMRDFNHFNVLNLKGICFDEDDSPIILIPYMNGGDLLAFIRDEENCLIVEDLLNFVLGISRGLKLFIFIFENSFIKCK